MEGPSILLNLVDDERRGPLIMAIVIVVSTAYADGVGDPTAPMHRALGYARRTTTS